VNFQSKLLLAMMAVVAGVSGLILLEMQKRVQDNYTRMFSKQFERQLSYFLARQEARLEAVKQQSLNLSQSAAVVTNLAQARPSSEALYLNATNETRAVLLTMFQEARLAFASAGRRYQSVFFRFLDQRRQDAGSAGVGAKTNGNSQQTARGAEVGRHQRRAPKA
jgi:hypothetical protein